MTAVMQSSTAAIAVTISALYAGAVSLEQGAALIIGQNIGTATSSALAAIGASTTAKRLALAYILFKIIAAIIAIVTFPFTAALMRDLTSSLDGTTLLAAYHTAYNVIGVAVLLPATQWFTRTVERLLPSKETALERALDPSALSNPVIAVEAARRVVADVLKTTAGVASVALSGGSRSMTRETATAATTLGKVEESFLFELQELPGTEVERLRMTSTLHALDHTMRLAEVLTGNELADPAAGAAHDLHAVALCQKAMQASQKIGYSITEESALSERAGPIGWSISTEVSAALAEAEGAVREFAALQRDHRAAVLASVAPGQLTAAEALARIDAVRRLERITHHAWRSAAHLLGCGGRGHQDLRVQPNSAAIGTNEHEFRVQTGCYGHSPMHHSTAGTIRS